MAKLTVKRKAYRSQPGSYREVIKRNKQLEIINEIAQNITLEMSFEEMMESVTRKLKEVISYDLLSFCLLDNDQLVISIGVPRHVPRLGIGTVLDRDSAMTWKVVRTKEFLIRYDIERDGHRFHEDTDLLELGIKSVIIVPLLVKNRVIGTLNLGKGEPRAYTSREAGFLQQVADQLAICIENSRLYTEATVLKQEWEKSFRKAQRLALEMSKRNLQLELINQLVKSVTVETSLEEMLDETAARLQKVISYDLFSFCLLEGGKLVIKKGIPKDQPYLGEGVVLDPACSAPGKVVREKRYFIRTDIPGDREKFAEDGDLARLNINSAIMVPLIVKQEVIGTLNLGSRGFRAYTDEDASFLQQVADHFALFIENARLYAEETRSKRAWEDTFQAVADMLLVVDKEYRLVRFNKAVERLKRERGGEVYVGQRCYEYFHPRHQKCRYCQIREVFATGRPVSRRLNLRSGRVWDVSAYPLYRDDGEVHEVIVSIHDSTEEVKMEAQLIHSAKLAAIGEIAAGVAHELNSPLTAIIGNALILERDAAVYPEEKVELLQDIRKCGIRCKKIIDNLRSFSRQESYEFEMLDLNEVVSDALALVSYQIENDLIEIVKKMDPDLPYVLGSKQHLEQIIINLLLNARDAVEDCPVKRIHILTGTREDWVFAAVRDTGCGIPRERLRDIFAPFYTTKSGGRGTGLGLPISLNLAEAHGGTVEVESEPGKGSTFYLMIPLPGTADRR